MKQRLSLFLATGCYLGLIPGAPGTCAGLATTLVFYLCYLISHKILPELHLSALGVVVMLGTLAASEVAQDRGLEDPQIVVIDEVAGQLLTFMLVPVSAVNLVLGTALFRVFDIWKPFPIRKLEHFPNGVGIMLDDLLAGAYSNLCLHLVNWLQRR